MLGVDIFMSKYCFLCRIQKDLDQSFWSKPFRPFWVLWKLSIWINSWFFLCFLNLNEFSVSKIQLWLLPAFCCLRFCKTMTIQHFMGKKYICYLNVEKWIMCLKQWVPSWWRSKYINTEFTNARLIKCPTVG